MITDQPETIAQASELTQGECSKAKSELEEKMFGFTFLENSKFPGFDHKDIQELLYKWGMRDHCYLKRFSYDRFLQPYEMDQFLLEFFNDGNVQPHIRVLSTMDRWGTLGKVTKVHKQTCNHTVVTLSFFDRLYEHGIVRKTGEIKKCFDEYHDGFVVSDELRKCLLMPEFETFALFSPEDRSEFIFALFKGLCLGGRVNQYEDFLDPYLDATKRIYKDLISVSKDSATGQLAVASHVHRIDALDSALSPLFPMEHPQNFCYVAIDPLRRHVNVFYHASDSYYS
ncbi:uncharacterized protein BJ171DRAFT_277520 [Polychytrium aggregatum]|uniref:uncharacterized protein n=1 Tax=Polychytrium aggregatum TaxID=110093 RepID=UPI0022FE0F1A|nr:uncharacterized protein BJ171DRAFT_277520 [Polychytrium aggregatum]KAI9207555.1 hypothetical protein BJ171DRAFT_277520 [Polychytrium aggregatum]